VIAPIAVGLPRRFAAWTAAAPLPLLAFALDGHISRLEGGLLVLWAAIALTGAARSGRALLDDEETGERVRHPLARLLAGLAVLTGGGWLLGEGLRTVVRHLGVSQTLLGNTALAASVEAEEARPRRGSRPPRAPRARARQDSPGRSSTSPR
jgi:Ca2+/Na+ antiporter